MCGGDGSIATPLLQEYAPHAPTEDSAPPPKLFFSVVEGTLFALHQFLQKVGVETISY